MMEDRRTSRVCVTEGCSVLVLTLHTRMAYGIHGLYTGL